MFIFICSFFANLASPMNNNLCYVFARLLNTFESTPRPEVRPASSYTILLWRNSASSPSFAYPSCYPTAASDILESLSTASLLRKRWTDHIYAHRFRPCSYSFQARYVIKSTHPSSLQLDLHQGKRGSGDLAWRSNKSSQRAIHWPSFVSVAR